MKSTLSIDNNTYKTFILLLDDHKEISFEEKELFSFIKNKNKELKIFNKDRLFILSKFKLELKNSLEKYISKKNGKARLAKLNKIISEGALVNKIKITDGNVTISNVNNGDDLNFLFSLLLKNKSKHSTLFKMLFCDKNIMINKFISRDKKAIFNDIEKIANNINKTDSFFTFGQKKQSEIYNKKISMMLEVPSRKPDAIKEKMIALKK